MDIKEFARALYNGDAKSVRRLLECGKPAKMKERANTRYAPHAHFTFQDPDGLDEHPLYSVGKGYVDAVERCKDKEKAKCYLDSMRVLLTLGADATKGATIDDGDNPIISRFGGHKELEALLKRDMDLPSATAATPAAAAPAVVKQEQPWPWGAFAPTPAPAASVPAAAVPAAAARAPAAAPAAAAPAPAAPAPAAPRWNHPITSDTMEVPATSTVLRMDIPVSIQVPRSPTAEAQVAEVVVDMFTTTWGQIVAHVPERLMWTGTQKTLRAHANNEHELRVLYKGNVMNPGQMMSQVLSTEAAGHWARTSTPSRLSGAVGCPLKVLVLVFTEPSGLQPLATTEEQFGVGAVTERSLAAARAGFVRARAHSAARPCEPEPKLTDVTLRMPSGVRYKTLVNTGYTTAQDVARYLEERVVGDFNGDVGETVGKWTMATILLKVDEVDLEPDHRLQDYPTIALDHNSITVVYREEHDRDSIPSTCTEYPWQLWACVDALVADGLVCNDPTNSLHGPLPTNWFITGDHVTMKASEGHVLHFVVAGYDAKSAKFSLRHPATDGGTLLLRRVKGDQLSLRKKAPAAAQSMGDGKRPRDRQEQLDRRDRQEQLDRWHKRGQLAWMKIPSSERRELQRGMTWSTHLTATGVERDFPIEVQVVGGLDHGHRRSVQCNASMCVSSLEHQFNMGVHDRFVFDAQLMTRSSTLRQCGTKERRWLQKRETL